jgi:hypothetical protein
MKVWNVEHPIRLVQNIINNYDKHNSISKSLK